MKSLLSLLLPESIFRRMINANPGLVSMTTYLPCLYLNLELGLACLRITRSRRPFRESADNVLGPKNYFMFAAFAFMMKVSIILIMIEWNYELTKKNWPVCVLGTVLLFDRFWFAAFAFMMKVSIILIMTHWNYQLKKKNWPVCELGTVTIQQVWFWICLWSRKVTGPFEKRTPDYI